MEKQTMFSKCSSLFTNSNWFAFEDDRVSNEPVATSPTEVMDEINLNGSGNGGNSSSDDEVVVGEVDELNDSKQSENGTSTSDAMNRFINSMSGGDLNPLGENENLFGDRPLPEMVGWGESSNLQVGGTSKNPFLDDDDDNPDFNLPGNTETVVIDVGPPSNAESILPNGSSDSMNSTDGSTSCDSSQKSPPPVPSLFEEDVEFVGVELEGTEKAIEQALKEGTVGEAGAMKRNITPKDPEKENSDDGGAGMKEFNDANYWRVDQEVAVLE